tara:strand:- start:133191 stop:134270 length:1080 start_codon:yes stop_codon:yes gene_type:complete
MEILTVPIKNKSYDIFIGSDLLSNKRIFDDNITSDQILIVTNEKIAPIYLRKIETTLGKKNIVSVILKDGEDKKTIDSFSEIIDKLIENKFNRESYILALGGGVIGDVAGFAASSYQRGINYIQIPTTLLAQVDSSIGGKTAVNHKKAKNMIGAFYQPKCVISDINTLQTLPKREFLSGLAEVIKHSLIMDYKFFTWLEKNIEKLIKHDEESLVFTIKRNCELKSSIVAEDEKEKGIRALLNLGHTFGHAIETITGYNKLLHGEAVSIGICIASKISNKLGLLDNNSLERIINIFQKAQLPTYIDKINLEELIESMYLDKKIDLSGLRLILLNDIGKASIKKAPDKKNLLSLIKNSIEK